MGWDSFCHGGGLRVSDGQGMKTESVVARVDHLLDRSSNHLGNRPPSVAEKEFLE